MRAPFPARLALGVIFTSMLLSAMAGEALAAIEVRLLHAVPGVPTARLELKGEQGIVTPVQEVSFGQATAYVKAPAGRFTLVVGGEDWGTRRLRGHGRHTMVVTRGSDGADTTTHYEDGEAVPGKTRWRMAHAVRELDSADVVLVDEVVDRLGPGEASDYRTVEPGSYRVGAMRPGEKQALVERPGTSLVAGSAQTAYLVGSGGERTRFVVLEDDASAPRVAPGTGLGGLGGEAGASWLAALGAALLAGALGGATYTLARRGRGPGRT